MMVSVELTIIDIGVSATAAKMRLGADRSRLGSRRECGAQLNSAANHA